MYARDSMIFVWLTAIIRCSCMWKWWIGNVVRDNWQHCALMANRCIVFACCSTSQYILTIHSLSRFYQTVTSKQPLHLHKNRIHRLIQPFQHCCTCPWESRHTWKQTTNVRKKQWLPYRQYRTVDDELTVHSRIYVLIYGNLHIRFRFRYRCF